ncbi:MAG: alternative ribosome rescue aminoacyl-tRNA hydrolase ArfB [Bacteroidota bacterium]
MNTIIISDKIQIPLSDLQFRFSRSGGPGGQNVNRVSTRVELIFDVQGSSLDPKTKELLRTKLFSKLDSAGCLRVVSQESRSQWQNKQDTVEKFTFLLKKVMRPVKHRTPTTATKSSKNARLARKKGRGRLKEMRKINMEKELR